MKIWHFLDENLCCVSRDSGYWRLCTDGKENGTDSAVIRDWAGRNWTPKWNTGHNHPSEHTHQQERKNEGNTFKYKNAFFEITRVIWYALIASLVCSDNACLPHLSLYF